MTASHQRPGGGDGSPFGNIATRGVVLVVIAVVIGWVLLAQGFGDRSDESAAAPVDTTTTTAVASSTTVASPGTTAASGEDGNGQNGNGETQDTVPETLHDPSEVVVLAANGSGESGVASALETQLVAQGYVAEAANANPTEASQILYRPGYGLDATKIAEGLGVDATVVVLIAADGAAPVPPEAAERAAASNVIVIAGSDGVIR
jgi:hypothetical protein